MAENENDFGLSPDMETDDDQKNEGKDTTPRQDPRRRDAAQYLPLLMLEAALTGKERRRFVFEEGIAVVIRAPAGDWVDPLLDAAKELTQWSFTIGVSAPERLRSKDTISQQQVLRAITFGRRALGVSQSPDSLLPAALTGSADLIVQVSHPSDAMVRQVIKKATGRAPRSLPANIAVGMDHSTITTAIRRGSTPAQCVERLVRARTRRLRGDGDLAAVPALASLHGYGAAMEWANRLMADLEAWRRGEIAFADIERTVVLASEPGLGKTTFVRSLSKSTALPLFASSVGTWFANSSGHLDAIVKQIDALFGAAAAAAPAIVFLDEIESIPNRTTMGRRNADYWMPVIGHMLTTLDGAGSGVSSRLIVIGATNHPEMLDPALVRPGRLSRIIHIERPDAAALAGILRQHLGEDLAGTDLAPLASFAVGATGAEVAGWVKAARAMARHVRRPLTVTDLMEQISPQPSWSPAVLHRVAIHEAAHAVVAQVLGLAKVEAVAIGEGNGRGGRTVVEFPGPLLVPSDIDAMALFILAGLCGEQVVLGAASNGSGGGEESDLARATALLATNHVSVGFGSTLVHRAGPNEAKRLLDRDPRLAAEVDKDLRRLQSRCIEIVKEHRDVIETVADVLARERLLTADRFVSVFDGAVAARRRIRGGRRG